MTKKHYPESKDLSRSRKFRRRFKLCDHYSAAQSEDGLEENPIDLLVESLPGMAERRREVGRLRDVVQRQVRNQIDFIKYEDARVEFTSLREEAYYNVAFERGRLAGLAESANATGGSDRAVEAFQKQVFAAVGVTELPTPKVAAGLIDVARAVILSVHCH